MNILVYDTETNGKAKDFKASYKNTDNWPRPITMAFIMLHFEGNVFKKVISEDYHILRRSDLQPDQWSKEAESVHGISYEQSMEEGEPIDEVHDMFISRVMDADLLCCHNADFDSMVMAADLYRYPENRAEAAEYVASHSHLCTMKSYALHSGGSWPKLENLYFGLIGKHFEGAHNALSDTRATCNVLIKMVRMGIIDFEAVAEKVSK